MADQLRSQLRNHSVQQMMTLSSDTEVMQHLLCSQQMFSRLAFSFLFQRPDSLTIHDTAE
jgi:hypothetical protein